jgi:hypothetical protein
MESAEVRMNFSPYRRTVSVGVDEYGRGGAGSIDCLCASTRELTAKVAAVAPTVTLVVKPSICCDFSQSAEIALNQYKLFIASLVPPIQRKQLKSVPDR